MNPTPPFNNTLLGYCSTPEPKSTVIIDLIEQINFELKCLASHRTQLQNHGSRVGVELVPESQDKTECKSNYTLVEKLSEILISFRSENSKLSSLNSHLSELV